MTKGLSSEHSLAACEGVSGPMSIPDISKQRFCPFSDGGSTTSTF